MKGTPTNEKLYVSGRLTADGFEVARCYSTTAATRWKRSNSSYVLESTDVKGKVNAQVSARVDEVCVLGGPPMRHLWGFLPLRKTAQTLRIRSGERTLWESPVLEAATVELIADVRRVNRGDPLVLRIGYSRTFEGASIQVFYEWAAGRNRVVNVFGPKRRFSVNLRSLPGGAACRIWVHYSNGMRSAIAASAKFKLPASPTSLTIVRPRRGTKLRYGQPLELEGQIVDPQSVSNVSHQGELVWLVDGKAVGSGPVACVMQPEPGPHIVELVHKESRSRTTTRIEVGSHKAGDPIPASLWDTVDPFEQKTNRSRASRR